MHKVHNPLHLFEAGKYHLFAIYSANNRKNCQFHINGPSAVYRVCRKMSPMHVTLEAGVMTSDPTIKEIARSRMGQRNVRFVDGVQKYRSVVLAYPVSKT